MSSTGDCFLVLVPHCATGSVIFGRNAVDAAAVGEAQEVYYYDASAALEGQTEGGAEPTAEDDALRMILQKPRPGVWGADCGANERNVSMGVTWVSQERESGNSSLSATDIVRLTLATAISAASGVERIGALVGAHAVDDAKFNFVICDSTEAWTVSSGGKLWAAQRFTDGYRRLPSTGLAVTTSIDKSSEALGDALQTLGLWSGEDPLNFSACLGAAPDEDIAWSGDVPPDDGSYSLTSMFDTLRSASDSARARSASVSVLTAERISCHWFTATPNASESVFKPFVFAPNPKISPLTKVPADSAETLLHKLHGQRKPAAVEDLKALEASCVEEVGRYLAEHPTADEELDELMKDCVEAEVKFYR